MTTNESQTIKQVIHSLTSIQKRGCGEVQMQAISILRSFWHIHISELRSFTKLMSDDRNIAIYLELTLRAYA